MGTSSLISHDDLYLLDTVASIIETLHSSSCDTKRKLANEDFAMPWHKCLGLISKQRIKKLVSDRILDSLDLVDFQVYIECIKGKQTNIRRLGANRSSNVLHFIHRNIYEPFPVASWNGQQYFISFIDDYSRYGYLYLIHEKSPSHCNLELVFKLIQSWSRVAHMPLVGWTHM